MPCNSDYLAPTHKERAFQKAAILLVYVLRESSTTPVQWMLNQAADIYARDERIVPALCEAVKSLNVEAHDRIVYNAKSKMSRKLADWWEKHQEADQKRERAEELASETESLRASALAKLSKAERRVLFGEEG